MDTSENDYPMWKHAETIYIPDMCHARLLEYKYLVVDKELAKPRWEQRNNRRLDLSCYFDCDQLNHVIVRD